MYCFIHKVLIVKCLLFYNTPRHVRVKMAASLPDALKSSRNCENRKFYVHNNCSLPLSHCKTRSLSHCKTRSSFFFYVFMDLDFVSVHKNAKKNNLANIQPSWPHAWSITHIAFLLKLFSVCTWRHQNSKINTHTHTHDPRPTTHDPRQLVILGLSVWLQCHDIFLTKTIQLAQSRRHDRFKKSARRIRPE